MFVSTVFLFIILIWGVCAASLYNGLHSTILSPNISTACDASLDTELNCESLIQLTPYSIQMTNWNTSSLSALCTAACNTSLAALASVSESACGDDVFTIDSNNMTLHDLVDLIQYKWGLVCLRDESTQDFCLDVENTWNITTMEVEGSATWPANTEKCYLDSSEGYWQILTDDNDTCLDPSWYEKSSVYDTSGYGDLSAMDYYVEAADPIDDDNYGWPELLDFDEYPLEIQCSSCFLQKFKWGYEKTWGNIWDEVTEQVWANIKLNCDLDEDLTPAHNVSGVITIGDWLADPEPITTNCPQNIIVSASESYTCHEAVVQFGIASSGLYNLNNNLDCRNITNTTICAPMSCPLMVVDLGVPDFAHETILVETFVSSYTNLTLAEFYSYNNYISINTVTQNDTVCTGPAIQIYQPTT